jgi:hypothetical protein
VNGSQLALGIRQSGLPVNDVVLPPWASGPEQLLAIHRWALNNSADEVMDIPGDGTGNHGIGKVRKPLSTVVY